MSDEHQHDEHQDQPQHTDYSPHDVEDQDVAPDPVHAGMEGAEAAAVEDDEGGEMTIAEEWGGDYPAGSQLFCASFDAEDFDDEWAEGDYSDGATVAIRRGTGTPPQGWIIRNAHMTDLERTKAIIEKHASPDALRILYSLNDKTFDAFVEAWGKDGGMTPGKSNRSARRSANKRAR